MEDPKCDLCPELATSIWSGNLGPETRCDEHKSVSLKNILGSAGGYTLDDQGYWKEIHP